MTRSKRKPNETEMDIALRKARRKPMRVLAGLVKTENRAPTGQRLPNTYYGVSGPEEAAGIAPVKVWTWREIEADGPNWQPPGYRCGGYTAKKERCSRVVFGERRCHWHKE